MMNLVSVMGLIGEGSDVAFYAAQLIPNDALENLNRWGCLC